MQVGESGSSPCIILVVDDDPGVRMMLNHALTKLGFAPRLADSGQQAIAMVQQCPVHLALLDVHMPGMSGVETLLVLRQSNPNLPCIFMTGHLAPFTRQELLAPGNVALLNKPFRLDELRHLIAKVCGLDR
jgi:CheY-like chemotaxis protein